MYNRTLMKESSPSPDAGQLQKQIDDADEMHPRYWRGMGNALTASAGHIKVRAAVDAIRSSFTPDLLAIAKELKAVPPDVNGAPLSDAQVLASVAEIAANRPRIIAGIASANGHADAHIKLVQFSVGLDGTLTSLAHETAPDAHKTALEAKEKVLQLGLDARKALTNLMAKTAHVTDPNAGAANANVKAAEKKLTKSIDEAKADEACSALADLIDSTPALETLLTYEIRKADKFGEPIEAPTNEQKAAVLKQIRGGLRKIKVMRAQAAQQVPVEDAVDTLNTLQQARDVLRELLASRRTHRRKRDDDDDERLRILRKAVDATTIATLKKLVEKLPQ
jgi:hypothetical protein